MNFLKAEIFYIAIAAIIAALILIFRGTALRRKSLRILCGESSNKFTLLSPLRRSLRIGLFFAILLLLATAAARPYWEEVERPTGTFGRDILIIFDVSKSMLATDRPPSRFQHAQMLVRELVKALPGDRFALIPFAGTSIISCPFTPDQSSINMYINELSTDSIPQGGTNLARALAVGERAFKSADGDNRVIVLLTDGEELSGDTASAIAELKKKNIPLLIFGIGDSISGAPIPIKDENGNTIFTRDEAGSVVYSKLNIPLLSKIAAETGGKFFDSTAGAPQIGAAIDFIKKIDKRAGEDSARMLPLEKFGTFIAPAVILLVIMLLISEYRKIALLLMILFFIPTLKAEDAATISENDLVVGLPTDLAPELLYNQARELQNRGETAQAIKLYEMLLKKPQSEEINAKVLHNLAVIKHSALQKNLASIQSVLQSQKIDEAKTLISNSEADLISAKQGYTDSLKVGATPGEFASNNVRRLFRDSQRLEELKKAIEELEKQQQQAKQDLEKAQKDNQQQQQSQQQQNQSEQQNSSESSQKSSKSESSSEQQNAAESSSQQAQQSLKDLAEKAQKLGQKDLAQKAEKAQQQVEKAQQSQAKENYPQAQKELEQAQQELGSAEQSEPSESSNKQEGAESPEANQPDQESADSSKNSDSDANEGKEGKEGKEADPDRESKSKLLEIMSDDEQQTRQELNNLQNRLRAPYKVERDY